MAIRTISNAGGLWSSTGTWAEGIVPTATDSVVATVTSGSVSFAVGSNICGTMDLTGYVGTFTFAASRVLRIGGTTLGDMTLGSGMTLVMASGSSIQLISTTTTANITTNGIVIQRLSIASPGGVCTYKLLDNITTSSSLSVNVSNHFNANNFNVTTGNDITNSGSIVMGSGTWTTMQFINGSTITANTSSIIINGTSGYIAGNANMLYKVTVNSPTLSIADDIIVSNNLTINSPCIVTVDASSPASITMSGAATLTLNSSQGNVITLQGDGSGIQWNINGIGGHTYNFSWLSLMDSLTDAPANIWNASSSIDSGNNTGWNITAPLPSGGGQGQGSLMLMSCGS